ncbi:MAG: substrate-binding domain-containing protein [Clostridia bacterium]|mgnify:FL=1|nr:substrate-binding domain-containing protein [Clostridia bacterium]MDD3971438.1 substrate-binding domain-containing protein [Clostridia bacterium]MDD4542934.1 substrate-binding domain-containing protein [Clostridia bacterium]
MKKVITIVISLILALAMFSGCTQTGFNQDTAITVISREEGSGTRGAFIELFEIEQKNSEGVKVDRTIATADINSSTGVVLASVAQNMYSIGYISLGSLNDTVKALQVDGADATVENIKSGTYKVSRPFNIAVKEGLSEVAQDFVNYILSKEGQAVVESAGYISALAGDSYSGIKPSGTVTVAGSSSVTPVMEKLKEAYAVLNPNAVIEINQSDSTTGVNSAIEGICDIGMASRTLKESEIEKGVTPTVIAIDGIAIIVNNENPLTGMTKDEVTKIYIGEITSWSEIGNE